jgi:hypothetical protein
VLACAKKYHTVEDALQILAEESELGGALWNFATLKIINVRVGTTISALVELFAAKAMSVESVNMAKFSICVAAEAIPGVSKLPARRDIVIPFQGDELPGRVGSIQAQVNACIAAAYKGAGVAQGKLPKLFCEDYLIHYYYNHGHAASMLVVTFGVP